MNTDIDLIRLNNGQNPFALVNPNRPQVNLSGIKADYQSEMMRTDINGKLDGKGLKRGDFTEGAVTILGPLVVGKVTTPTQINTLKSLGALPEVEALNVAKQSALTLEKADSGHSIKRHGPEISDADLKARLKTGIAPDGKFSPTKASTKFNSYEDWLQTRNAALEQIQKKNGVDFSKPPVNVKKYEIITEYDRAIDDGFVGKSSSKLKVSDLKNPNKKGNVYSKYEAVDGITRTKTTVAWDASTNSWKVVQHFPVAEGWNNTTKAYNLTEKVDVKVTLPSKGGNK